MNTPDSGLFYILHAHTRFMYTTINKYYYVILFIITFIRIRNLRGGYYVCSAVTIFSLYYQNRY